MKSVWKKGLVILFTGLLATSAFATHKTTTNMGSSKAMHTSHKGYVKKCYKNKKGNKKCKWVKKKCSKKRKKSKTAKKS